VIRVLSSLTRRIRPGSSIRSVLIAGFAVVFGLWLLSGYQLVRRLAALEQRTAAEHQAALSGARLLTTIRTNVLLGSIFLRDAIIDNRSIGADYYWQELNRIRGEVEQLLPDYSLDVTSAEDVSTGHSFRKSSRTSGNHESWRSLLTARWIPPRRQPSCADESSRAGRRFCRSSIDYPSCRSFRSGGTKRRPQRCTPNCETDCS
jgi:hypothetical protein